MTLTLTLTLPPASLNSERRWWLRWWHKLGMESVAEHQASSFHLIFRNSVISSLSATLLCRRIFFI
jgi:hypothetical protein